MAKVKISFRALNPEFNKIGRVPSAENGYAVINKHFNQFNVACENAIQSIDSAIEELNRPISVTTEEIEALLDRAYADADKESVELKILKPIFMSVIDGAMRSFNVTSQLGLSPSRVLEECEHFSYSDHTSNIHVSDSLTEHAYEKFQRESFGAQRTLTARDLRDPKKMKDYKEEHFDGNAIAQDEYNPDANVYKNNKHAFENDGIITTGNEKHPESAEVDHVVPCKVICDNMKKNKALKNDDIKYIVNCKENLAITSCDTNNAKRSDTNSDFVKKHIEELSENEIKALLDKEKNAKQAIDRSQNKAVVNNLIHDSDIQKTFAKDAGKAAIGQVGGVFILHIMKPLYFEIKDSIRNGLENGVDASDFKEALKIRFVRVKEYILNSLPGKLTASVFQFLQSFVSMLIEAIIGCLAGVFKMIWRVIKEGFKIIVGAMSVINDKTKSLAEKGDTIMQLAAISVSAVAGIYIDGAVKNLGLPEPWSILLASISSAIVASGMLYILHSLDIFHAKKEMRRRRILEILENMNEQIEMESKEPLVLSSHSYSSVLQIA